jgi:hypothetical protein
MSENANKQHRLMAQRIKQFEGGKISLKQFVDDMDALLEGVESAEESWRASFRKGLAELKDVCAYAGDRCKKELSAEHRGRVHDGVTRIKGLLVLAILGRSNP